MSGLLSSVIHNAPITKILIPVVNGMSTAENKNILFSSVSLGTVLGENLSTMGDNLVIITMVREHGYELEFSTFMRLGIIITLIQLISSTIFIIMKINYDFIIIGIILLILILIISLFYTKIFNSSKKFYQKNLQKKLKNLHLFKRGSI